MSDFLERYKPGAVIQQGTIGQSFTAIDLQHNRPVIIKHIGCSNKEAAAAVLHEWARLLSVRDSSLVQVFETDLDELDFYMAVEYVEGNSLRRLLSSLPEQAMQQEGLERILWSARSFLEALSVLHASNIAHGDLCPENIWFHERVVLLDSGLARLARLASMPEDPRLRSALHAIPIGSPAYRAPELALGAMPTPGSDMYSVGVILHESLSGRLPGAKGLELPDSLAENELLNKLLTSLISFQPEQRPTPSAAIAALDELLRTPPALVQRLARNRTRHSDKLKIEAQAIEAYQARAALLLETDSFQRASLHRAIAAHLASRMNHDEALEECWAGQADAAAVKDPQAKARAIASLLVVEIQVCFNKARFEEAIAIAHQALKLMAKAGIAEQDSKEAAKIYIRLARIYYRQGKQAEMTQALERARMLGQLTQYEGVLAEADVVEAVNVGWSKGELDEAIMLGERGLNMARKLELEWLQSEALRVLGGCYQYKNDTPNATHYYRQALEVAEHTGLPDLVAAALYNMGLICEIEGDFESCESYFLRSLEIAGKAELPRPQAVAYKGLDLLYEQLGRLAEAYEQARLHLRLIQEMSDQLLLPDAQYQVGTICLEMGRLEESEFFINAGREIAENTDNNLILVELERLAAALRLRQGRLEEAEQLLAQARSRIGGQLGETALNLDRIELELAIANLEAREVELDASDIRPLDLIEAYQRLADRSEEILASVHEVKPSLEARFLALHGRILSLAGNWSEAETAFKQAIQRADELKQRLSLALALHLYGRSLLEKVQKGSTGRLGQRGRAMGLLANAKAVYSECSAAPGVESVNRLLQDLHTSSAVR